MEKKRLKVCFFSPYIPTSVGGGEKHLFEIADIIKDEADIFFALPDSPAHTDTLYLKKIQEKYEQFLSRSLDYINWIPTPLGTDSFFLKKYFWTTQFDYLIYATDGSLFFSGAKHNILHIQVPLLVDKNRLFERMKLKTWQTINTNSYFTKKIIEQHWNVTVNSVVQPSVDTTAFNPAHKKLPVILNVGRFFKHLHSKRQDIAIAAFKQLLDENPKLKKIWQLKLVGPIEDKEYVEHLNKQAEGYPITFYHTISRERLIELYNSSSIFWHMAGYGIKQHEEPEKVEHFGISTVEAMAAGCVPLVVGKGGQLEVIGKDLIDLSWQRKEELLKKTQQLMQDPELLNFYKERTTQRAHLFNMARFRSEIRQLFSL